MTIAASVREYQFVIHGMDLCYRTSSRTLVSSVATWVHQFRRAEPLGRGSVTIHFEEVVSRNAVPLALSPASRHLFSGTRPVMGSSMRALWQCDIFVDEGRLIVDVHGHAVLIIDASQGMAHGYFVRPESMHPDLLESYFHYAMSELLKRQDMFTLHATALEYHGRGLLLPGNSGCGKTTGLLALLRAGYRYLSDDHPILHDAGTHVELLAAPMKIEVTDQTVSFIPELRESLSGLLPQGVYKKSFHVEDIFPASSGQSCLPSMILFPQVTPMSYSCLQPMEKSEALAALMSSASLVHDDRTSTREFLAISKLVRQAACYRLHFGQDILDLPRLISPLLERH